MSTFIPSLAVTTTGQMEIGRSPHKSLSILSIGVTGTIGVFHGGIFYPHHDGAINDGEMFTFDCGVGRVVGIEVTAGTGTISSAAV